jgi:polysaccharide pyruvyl transferase WcaK-like protein
LFSGYYGRANAGDDIFCAVAALARDNVDVPYMPWFLSRSVPLLAEPSVQVLDRSQWIPSRVRLAGSAVACRHVVQFGGSTLSMLTRGRADLARLARARLIRLSAVGVSIGPFTDTSAAKDVGRFLSACTDVVVRDLRSVHTAEELGLIATLGFDPAILLPRLLGRQGQGRTDTGPPTIGVSISSAGLNGSAADAENGQRFGRLAALLRHAQIEHSARIRLVNMLSGLPEGDDRATAWLATRLAESGIVEVYTYRGDIPTLLDAIETCTAVVGVRLHSCILAYALGVPFVLVDYHAKCGDFLNTIGAPHMRAGSALENFDEVTESLRSAMAGTAKPATVTPAEAEEQCLAALDSTELWRGVLLEVADR